VATSTAEQADRAHLAVCRCCAYSTVCEAGLRRGYCPTNIHTFTCLGLMTNPPLLTWLFCPTPLPAPLPCLLAPHPHPTSHPYRPPPV
jgi:hypothetical protein